MRFSLGGLPQPHALSSLHYPPVCADELGVKVLFVCYGNICRSPMAEALFRRAAADYEALVDLKIESAGVGALVGNCATDPAQDAMRTLFDLDLGEHRARRFRATTDADLVLALDEDTLRAIRRFRVRSRVERLGDYAGTGEDVEDPFLGTRADYERAARHIERLVRAAAARLAAERSHPDAGA